MNPNDTSLQSKVYNFVNLTLCVVGAWVAVSKENKTAINLARLFLRPIWPSRIPLTMYFDGRGTLKRKWRRLVFFSRMAFFPIYHTAGLLPDHELREVLKSRKITILGSKSIRDLKQPLEAVKKRRRGPRGIDREWVEATTPSLFSPTLKNCKRYKKRTSKLRLSSLSSKCDTIPGYKLT